MRDLFMKFRKSESGATLVEYGVALILAIVLGGGALVTLADQTGENMLGGCDALSNPDALAANAAAGGDMADVCG